LLGGDLQIAAPGLQITAPGLQIAAANLQIAAIPSSLYDMGLAKCSYPVISS
jgi:hypothetical protein